MSRILLGVVCLVAAAELQAGIAGDIARQVRQTALDAQECYRVRDIRFTRDEVKLYFTEGFLIFGKAVNGQRISAVFSAEVDGGDAELLLMPPFQRERRSLAVFARSPTLDEHFRHAVMIFTDNSAAELLDMVKANGAKKSAEMGNILADKWNPVMSSFIGSFEVRLVEDLLSPDREKLGFFFSAFGGNPLGNFDLIFDPRARHQISVGQVMFREDRRYFDIWANFQGRSWRMGQRKAVEPELKIDRIQIDAVVEQDLSLKAVTRMRLTPLRRERTIGLDLSQQVRVTEVKVNGVTAEAFYPESLRANLLRSNENQMLLITGPEEFASGAAVDLEFHHEGKVITQAGNGVYYVGARGTWYPNRQLQFAPYEVSFRYPKQFDLVATGNLISETVEGEWKISKRKTSAPVRLFGFNLGDYERTQVSKGGLTVEVCANKKLEAALQPKPRPVDMTTGGGGPMMPRGQRQRTEVLLMPPPPPNPAARLQQLASDVAGSFEEMAARFGKPAIQRLTVSPIPGRFGQGFPGLVYMSTLAYLDPSDRQIRGNSTQQIFFSELLHAHEVAHQWWGNGVTSADYQDDWLMEALANYSALWMLERRKGVKTLDSVLEEYKSDLLKKQEDGQTVESAGPVTLGQRLSSSLFPGAWSVITYEKGSWILHMLRKRMGDERFSKMLAQLYQRYLYHSITTEQFRQLAVEFLPPGSSDPKLETFFEQWVNGTGIPTLKLHWSVSGKAPGVKLTGTITQTDVDENFSAWVPVEVQMGRLKPVVRWVQTSSEPVQFQMALPAAPLKVVLDPGNATLAKK